MTFFPVAAILVALCAPAACSFEEFRFGSEADGDADAGGVADADSDGDGDADADGDGDADPGGEGEGEGEGECAGSCAEVCDPGGNCVECYDDGTVPHAGCQGRLDVCVSGRCVDCADTVPEGLTDLGCADGAPICADGDCEVCTDDGGGGPHPGCDVPEPFCVGNACLECRRDADCASFDSFCTPTQCVGGICVAGEARLCTDADDASCTIPECDEASRQCAEAADDGVCPDDGSLCTAAVCDPGDAAADPETGCINTVVDCDDDATCTTDTCDGAMGCANAPSNGSCPANPGNPCFTNSTGVCDPDNPEALHPSGCVYVPQPC